MESASALQQEEQLKKKNKRTPFRDLTHFERGLWIVSMAVIVLAFLLSGNQGYLTMITALIGVTGLIFQAKGYPIGQIFIIGFSILYGVVSISFHYYGEMITYLCMALPMAVLAFVQWMRHPYQDSSEVEISVTTRKQMVCLLVLTAGVTAAFYFILGALGNANLPLSTVSIATSFFGSGLIFLRSRFYAVGWIANDCVVIGLWTLASMEERLYLPMLLCFVMFLFNDIYALANWQRMKKRQTERL